MTGFDADKAALIAPLLGFGLTLGLVRMLAPRSQRYGLVDHPAGDAALREATDRRAR